MERHDQIPGRRLPLVAAVATLAAHLIANPHYGFFRDELYFIVCGRHPAFGYVDQPPLVPLLAALTQISGPSLVLLRASAAVFAAASVYTTCLLARELGGGRFAQALGALASALSPVLCSFGMKITTDTPGLWLWPLATLYLLRLFRGGPPRNWIGAGVALGICAEAKFSVVYFAAALFLGLLCTRKRRIVLSPWFLLCVAIAAALALPAFLWQAGHGFPMLELLRNGQHGKNVVLSPGAYLLAELMVTNPLLAPVWIAGLFWLLADADSRPVGVGFLILIAAMIASHAKHYYPADIYPVLFAAGGVAIERATAKLRALRPVGVAWVAMAGAISLPYVLPILPVPAFLAYHRVLAPLLHLESVETERHRRSVLPQDWADMQGWPEMAEAVAKVYASLDPAERPRAAIVAGNYGEAAAIDFFGARYGLPPALSGHNQYFLWGPRGHDGQVVIDVGGDCAASGHLFEHVERAAVFSSPLSMPYEDQLPILVCRGIRRPLPEIWPAIKLYL
jgi:hypothetical protein